MRKIIMISLLLLLSSAHAETPDPAAVITKAQGALGVRVLKSSPKAVNQALSPYSLHSGLMLARLGAAGETAAELDSVLLSSPLSPEILASYSALNSDVFRSTEEVAAKLANSIWISDTSELRKEYLADTEKAFSAEPRSIDFTDTEGSRKTINSWVSEQTAKLIPDLIPKGMISKDTLATLVNAVYFKAPWSSPFLPGRTKDGDFWIDGATRASVPMMRAVEDLRYFENNTWQAVSLSYGGERYNFIVLLPRQRLSSAELTKQLSTEDIDSARQGAYQKVDLHIPRFKVRQGQNLVDSLKALGLSRVFSDQADFSKLSTPPIKIGAVQHEAVVSVDEKGTEAAAATAVMMVRSAAVAPETPATMTIDHPFVFVIEHGRSQAVLFMGVIGDPGTPQ